MIEQFILVLVSSRVGAQWGEIILSKLLLLLTL